MPPNEAVMWRDAALSNTDAVAAYQGLPCIRIKLILG